MSNRYARLLYALLVSIVLQTLIVILFYATGAEKGESIANRIAVLLGGNLLGGGYIQFLEFVAFFWCLFDMSFLKRFIKKEQSYLNTDVLPIEEHAVISANEVNQIRMRISSYLTQKQLEYPDQEFFLLKMIKRVCTKFRSNFSVSEAMDILNSQVQINLLKSETGQSTVRYTIWAIPSIGFIGTVLGISQALGIADSGDTKLITSTLGVAFDTTLVSLILSVVLMWLFHDLQERIEKLHTAIQEYVMENLINRIYAQ